MHRAWILALAAPLLLAGCLAADSPEDPLDADESAEDEPAPEREPDPEPSSDDDEDDANDTQPEDHEASDEAMNRTEPSGPDDLPETLDCAETTLEPAHATHGESEAFQGLTWAALKTGFRAAVTWTTEEPAVGRLEVQVGNETRTLEEERPRETHAFVLDELPQGEDLCFTAHAAGEASRTRGMHLANAMTAYDRDAGAYTVNLLALANEAPDRAALEDGLARAANLTYDATEGHLAMGTTILLYGDLDNHHSGWSTCHVAFVSWPDGADDPPTCNRVFDVVLTYDLPPAAAGATYLDGIQNPRDAMWLNNLWQGSRSATLLYGSTAENARQVGHVLAHELGHYAYGAMDLYTNAGAGPDCYDEATGISIMGANRDATELDGPDNRCPNEDAIDGYTPSWTLLRERFDEVPERTGEPTQQAGAGPWANLATLDRAPTVDEAAAVGP